MALETCAAAPCRSCPYRQDVPSGLWHPSEYEKLPAYDGEIAEQALAGAVGVFRCHQQDGKLCAGWIATHGAKNLFAIRFAGDRIDPALFTYSTPVPVFASGQEASDHGMRDVAAPGRAASRIIDQLTRKQRRRTR